jgi:integrase
MNDELVRFKLYLTQGRGAFDGKLVNRSPRTVELYISLLRRLLQHCPNLTVDEIGQHLLSLRFNGNKGKGCTGNYLNDYIHMLQIYGRFKETDVYEQLEEFPEEEFTAGSMSNAELNDFLKLPPPTYTRRYKSGKITYITWNDGWDMYTMFWKLFAYHPVRPGGIAHLTIEDVDWGLEALHFKDKTRKDGLMPIHPAIKDDLKNYIDKLQTNYLFPSKNGGTSRQGAVINDVDWGYNFHQRLKRLGIKRRNLRPYSVRHASITRLLRAGNNIFMVMNLAGQKRPETLLKYWHNDLDAQLEAMKKDPLGKHMMPFYDKQKMFRDEVFKLLESYAQSQEEELKLIESLKIF